MRQRTIAEKISCTGIGLHSGQPVEITLHPARIDSGITFLRSLRGQSVRIPALADSVSATAYATTLGSGVATVSTVEHLLAALHGLGIDNVDVEVDGPEIPILDGSAASFVFLIRSAGVFEQAAPRRVVRVRRPVEVRAGERWIRLEPGRGLRVHCEIDFAHPAIGRQRLDGFELTPERFEEEIASARTFGFVHEVDTLWRAGLARGASLENTIVLDENGVMNPDGLRMPDEIVRHKVLDLIGDLALLGSRLQATVHVCRGGHALHQKVLATLLADPTAYDVLGGATRPSRRIGLPQASEALRATL